jgi:phosphatidylserine/phosphatidylglycerophosphate/cardiolipin synthase-like enzyme
MNRSLRINFEITMTFTDVDFIHRVEAMCVDDFALSDPLTTDDIYARHSSDLRCARRAYFHPYCRIDIKKEGG